MLEMNLLEEKLNSNKAQYVTNPAPLQLHCCATKQLLTKKDEFEWIDLFEENKKKAQELKAEIDRTDKEIDNMVCELYALSEEEMRIIQLIDFTQNLKFKQQL